MSQAGDDAAAATHVVSRVLRPVAGPALLVTLLFGCPTPVPDDDASATDDDDTTDDPDTLQVPGSLPPAGIHEVYEETLIPPDFHQPPLTWSRTGGTLPAGLALQSNGDVEGVATELGSFVLEVRVEDDAGRIGEGSVGLDVELDEDKLFVGVWLEQPPLICVNLELLCAPHVRIQGTGEDWAERPLAPALFHVGPDGLPDAGLDDDVLWELLDAGVVTWSWTPLEDPTGDGTTLYPEDATITPGGQFTAGELTGRGRIGIVDPDHGEGTAIGFVVPPDWCPGLGC